MDKNYIDDNDIKSKYLRGVLTDDEVREFESYLIENPKFVEQVELEDVLFKVLPQLEGSSQVQNSKFWSFLDIPLRRVLLPALTCMVALPIVLTSVFTSSEVQSVQAIFLSNESYRTANEQNTNTASIGFQNDQQLILLMLYPENESAENFNIAIRKSSGDLLQDFPQRSRGDLGYVGIELSSAMLEQGSYLLDIVPVSTELEVSSALIESIPFNIR